MSISKLPILKTAFVALKAPFVNFKDLALASILPLIIIVPLLAAIINFVSNEMLEESPLQGIFLALTTLLLLFYAGCLFTVKFLRSLLKEEPVQTFSLDIKPTLKVVGYTLMLTLIYSTFSVLNATFQHLIFSAGFGEEYIILPSILLSIIQIFIALRLVTVIPSSVDGVHQPLRTAFKATRGVFWRIFGVIAILYLIVIPALLGLGFVGFFATGLPIADPLAIPAAISALSSITLYGALAGLILLSVLFTGMYTALGAVIYKNLKQSSLKE